MTNWEKLIEGNEYHKLLWRDISAFQLPQDHFTTLKIWCEQGKERGESVNTHLIGHLKEEYKIVNFSEDFERYIINCSLQQPVYNTWQGLSINSENRPIYLDNLWVNYQKKYEFNPPHDHSGFVSFIIFVKIPYDLNEEEKCYPYLGKTSRTTNHTSKLSFLNVGSDGIIKVDPIDVDKSFEGKMLMFSAKQMHEVYPFYTSDDYRITVSGNLKIKV